MLCDICLWNESHVYFDDTEYSPPFGQTFSNFYQFTGYNYIINENRYNTINVCNKCLIQNVYKCDINLKEKVLDEIKFLFASKIIQKWWLNILYNIDTNIGKNFIFKNISPIFKKTKD